MARNKGIASFSANFEPQIAAPLDGRLVVDRVTDLTSPTTWEANDGSVYIYKGIIVSVVNDVDPESNRPYCLVGDDYTIPGNWKVFGGGDVEMDNRIMEWEAFTAYTKNTPLIYDSILYVVIEDNYTSTDDIEDDVDGGFIDRIGGGDGASSGETYYTNTNPMEIGVGGIETGSTFDKMSMEEMWDALLYPELKPTLTNPSISFTSSVSGLREVGEEISTIDFTATFNRGTINPPYGTSGYRSGLPNKYTYTGDGLTTVDSDSMSDEQQIVDYVVLEGAQSWTCYIDYDGGEQPLTNKGGDFDSPLASGSTTTRTTTITGVYPIFATTANIGTLTKQTTLVLPSSNYFEVNMVKEEGGNKQTISFHDDTFPNITGIEFFNTVSNSWEWIGGSKATSLASFTKSVDSQTIHGSVEDYVKYEHNGATIGARMLRFHK